MNQIAYKAAVDSLNHNLETDNQERHFLSNLVGACKYWMGRDEPDIKLKQFTTKGTFILDPNKIDQLLQADQLNLQAQYVEMEHNLPKIIIVDTVTGKALVSIRTYRNSKGYIRNYIEKEPLWMELTLVKHIPNKPKKVVPAPVAAAPQTPITPVPSTKTPAMAKVGQPMGQEPDTIDDIRFSGEE